MEESARKDASSERKRIPEEEASLPSHLFFFWARGLFQRASVLSKQGKALEHEDLLPLPTIDYGKRIGPAFANAWNKEEEHMQSEQKRHGASEAPTVIGAGLADAVDGSYSTTRVRHAIFAVIGRRFLFAGLIKVLNTALQFSFPLLLNEILAFIEDTQAGRIPEDASWEDKYRGYWLSAILFAAMAAKAITENVYFHKVYRAGYQARVAVSAAVYNKALRLANAERQGTTLGELINLMQVDATKIEMFVPQIHVLWDGVLQICGYITILYTLIGWPCFAGLAIMMFAGPVQGIIMKRLFALNRTMVKHTDSRIKTTNEALQGIQCVKMYTWEESFQREIGKARNEELDNLKGVAYLRGFSRAYMGALPGIVAVASFIVFAAAKTGSTISASTLFAALVAFDQLRFPLLFYPLALAQLAQANVSARRVEIFLQMQEIGKDDLKDGGLYFRDDKKAEGGGEIAVKDVNIYWSDPNVPIDASDDDNHSVTTKSEVSSMDEAETPTKRFPKAILESVSLRVAPGELCAVVGRVGSGKSTLCSAILGETLLQSGEVQVKGRIAYASQSAWILNATLRDNILFGMPFDQEKYDKVLKACQLSHDLDMLDNGDMTEIGERGINLSGGQKQRVSVARAAYSDADLVVLDDPLSALDPEVGRQLFEECIVDLMKEKTRLFVTNQLQFLRYCDSVVALGKRKVIEQGTFDDLNAAEGGEVRRLLNELKSSEQSQHHEQEENSKVATVARTASAAKDPSVNGKKEKKSDAGLVTKEERNIGAVSWEVYKKYVLAGGGYFKFFCVYFGFVLSAANGLASTSWVSFWTSDSEYERNSQVFYLSMYAMLAVTLGLFTYMRAFLLARFGVRAAEKFHKDLLESVLQAPQSFFDTTPVGRILSRFSKDMYSIDVELSDYFDFFLFTSLTVVVSLGTIMFVTPWFGVAILPLGFVYFRVLNYFRNVSRETKRLESISRSPVYAHFSETLGGLSTIRAYGQSIRFMEDFEGKVDYNTRAYYSNKTADRWLSVRLELIGATIAGLAAVFSSNVAISDSVSGQDSDSNFASLAGLSLSFAISLTSLLNWCVRSFAQLEAAMNACERVLYYTENIPQEAPRTSDELEDATSSSTEHSLSNPAVYATSKSGGKADRAAFKWPDKGEITLKNLRMRYRAETPLVLKGLNVTIHGGERIGVVGRTGSGKSSLLLTLLRLVEPSLEEGDYQAPLSIDGVDVLRIGLKDLRSKLGIIPQNPVLFSGTVRSNIDPFDEYSDKQIWDALSRCGMKESVENMPGMLNASIAEYGENLSAGMRQMLVLGRALLKQCRILLLDEATSSVDYETDREIQRTLREAFNQCTILTIAHRINTIMDSDKILVMKDGYVEEFAPPQELLKDENSTFSEIVRHAKSGEHQ
jgi:ABC-type multidrug transport system fused ATPase/permease subunit